ncbi:MAG: class I SAM-dependent methyltransferase [Burkholderiaceae bacterium]
MAATDLDPLVFKAAARDQWDRCAHGWHDHDPQLQAWLRGATQSMLDAAGVVPGAAVLDVAAGSGGQTRDIATAVGPTGRVLATDLSPVLVALAADNARRAGLMNVTVRVADAEDLDVGEGVFDAAVCRLGLMLMPEPAMALRGMLGSLRPGARAAVLVFGEPARNPCVSLLMKTALEHAGLPPRDPFAPGSLLSLGANGRLAGVFESVGFEDVRHGTLAAPFELPSAGHYLEFVRTSASPIVQILAALPPAAAEAAWSDMEARLQVFASSDGWIGPNELVWVSGRRPA